MGPLSQKPLEADHEEAPRVVRWRREVLLRAGYSLPDAKLLAKRTHVDLHQAVELVERGCPPERAVEILL